LELKFKQPRRYPLNNDAHDEQKGSARSYSTRGLVDFCMMLVTTVNGSTITLREGRGTALGRTAPTDRSFIATNFTDHGGSNVRH